MTSDSPHLPPPAEVRLDQPYYGASLGIAVARFFRKYATFSGRASRSEFWWSYLFYSVVTTVLYGPLFYWITRVYIDLLLLALESAESGSSSYYYGGEYSYLAEQGPSGLVIASFVVGSIWGLATAVPSIAIHWRRLHDAGFSGLFWLFNLANLGIVPLIMCILPSKPDGARYDKPGAPGHAQVAPGGYGQPGAYPAPGGVQGPAYGQPYDQPYGQPAGYPAPEPPAGGAYAPPGYAPPGYAPPATPAEPAPPVIGPDGLPRYPG
ncbi:MAG: DUF805 domain-containing protein [Bifidobacteriaceae bacterium]|jgi:uncharacterized membrane protein YhaH (DUF805 family)|nr:DUF805 domain-containing protein [Bifidobacteriaceae bacterium]